MAEKVTMVLEVNLECHRCYKKVNKILPKFPEIQDPKYNEKENTVTITVVSCRPEKIRDKLYCKGKGFIRCIKIIVPKPKKDDPKDTDPKDKKDTDPKDKKDKKDTDPKKVPVIVPAVTGHPPMYPINGVIGICLVPYCEGYGVRGHCNHGYGIRPGALGRCYDGCRCGCGGGVIRPPPPCYDGCGCGCGGFYVNRPCDLYFCEENPRCAIM